MSTSDRRRFNERNIAEFRASGGQIPSYGDGPVLVLSSIGAKSGKQRTNPLMYLADDHALNRVYVFASAAGDDKNPDWFSNVLAHPTALTVEIGDETVAAEAEILPEPLRSEIFAIQADRHPRYAAYQEKTSRQIPVIALTLKKDRRS
jgi:deazaflavin-dependent oxidoreductase (nitroreductase family)